MYKNKALFSRPESMDSLIRIGISEGVLLGSLHAKDQVPLQFFCDQLRIDSTPYSLACKTQAVADQIDVKQLSREVLFTKLTCIMAHPNQLNIFGAMLPVFDTMTHLFYDITQTKISGLAAFDSTTLDFIGKKGKPYCLLNKIATEKVKPHDCVNKFITSEPPPLFANILYRKNNNWYLSECNIYSILWQMAALSLVYFYIPHYQCIYQAKLAQWSQTNIQYKNALTEKTYRR